METLRVPPTAPHCHAGPRATAGAYIIEQVRFHKAGEGPGPAAGLMFGAQERWYYLTNCPSPSCARGRPGAMVDKASIPSKALRAVTAPRFREWGREQKPLIIQLSLKVYSTSRCPLRSLALMSDAHDALPREEMTEQDYGGRLKIQRQPQITKSLIPTCLSRSTCETGGSASSSS